MELKLAESASLDLVLVLTPCVLLRFAYLEGDAKAAGVVCLDQTGVELLQIFVVQFDLSMAVELG